MLENGDQHDDRRDIDLATEEAQRRRRRPRPAAVDSTAEAEALVVLRPETAGPATRLSAIARHVPAPAAGAALGTGCVRQIAVDGEQEIVESGVRHRELYWRGPRCLATVSDVPLRLKSARSRHRRGRCWPIRKCAFPSRHVEAARSGEDESLRQENARRGPEHSRFSPHSPTARSGEGVSGKGGKAGKLSPVARRRMRSAGGTLDTLQYFGVAPENILIIVLHFVGTWVRRKARIELSILPSFFFG